MLESSAHLARRIFDKEVDMAHTRAGYGEGLLEAGRKNKEVVALSADLTDSTKTSAFAKEFPTRFIEVGVAEQNMVTVAAGLAISGKIPYVASYATFCPGRCYEQIRTTISYNNANVKIAGHHAGVSVGPDGVTHQAVEDIALMRVLANMKVIYPCDSTEAKKATVAAAGIWGPVYIRLAREKTPVFTTIETPFVPGKVQEFFVPRGKLAPRVVILGSGPLLHNALLAARVLENEKIPAVVLNVHTIKPLDTAGILHWVKKCRAVVTVEEHQVSGGMGSTVAEMLAKNFPAHIEMIGLQNTFAQSGPPQVLVDFYGMGVKDIIASSKKVIKRSHQF